MNMNPKTVTSEELRIRQITDLLRNLDSDSIDRVIAELEYELRARNFEEQIMQEYDDLLANQYA